jgi:MerR family transcriptional regulator/heat shock protein HspR
MTQQDDERWERESLPAPGSGSTESRPEGSGAWHPIGVAAERAGVHEQTLRHYERLGLISPARRGTRPHSPRLYSERDIERVVHIRRLMGELGVNLAGVETILHMRDRMESLRREAERELARLRREHEAETRRLREALERLQR